MGGLGPSPTTHTAALIAMYTCGILVVFFLCSVGRKGLAWLASIAFWAWFPSSYYNSEWTHYGLITNIFALIEWSRNLHDDARERLSLALLFMVSGLILYILWSFARVDG